MMNLERIHVINKAALSGKNYFASMMLQGRLCCLLTDKDIERLQLESLALLAEQTEKWSRGESSSIRVEKAQELLASVYYTVGLALKAYPSPEDAIDALKREGLDLLFRIGQEQITGKIRAARRMHQAMKKKLFRTRNVFYRSTVADGIDGFFKLYRPEFSAQEIHITVDYPAFMDVTDLIGIEFIEGYLKNIGFENQFLLLFSANSVHHLLCGLDENYPQIPMNIYEPVLAAALGCVLTDQSIRELSCDLDTLKELLDGRSREEIEGLLCAALRQMMAELDCSSGLAVYLRSSLPKLALLIQNAMRMGHLETIVLIPVYPENKPKIFLSYGERMNDRDYESVLEEVMWCESAEKKTEIILSKIHSLGDFLEILRDSEPTQKELVQILGCLPEEIIAVLLRQYPNDDFLSDEREINIYSALQEILTIK